MIQPKILVSNDKGLNFQAINTNIAENNSRGQNLACYGNDRYLYIQQSSNKIYHCYAPWVNGLAPDATVLSNWTRLSNNARDDLSALGIYPPSGPGLASYQLHSIIYKSGKFICGGSYWTSSFNFNSLNILSTSVDGINWTAVPPILSGTSDINGNPYYLFYSDVGGANGGVTNILSDTSLYSEIYFTSGSLREMTTQAYAFGQNFWKVISFDGLNWTAMPFERMATAASCIGDVDGKFVEIGNDANGNLKTFITTINANGTASYTKHDAPFITGPEPAPSNGWNGYGRTLSLDYGVGIYVATMWYTPTNGSNAIFRIATSSNAIDWNYIDLSWVVQQPIPFYNGVKFCPYNAANPRGNGIFVINQSSNPDLNNHNNTDRYLFSTNGTSWLENTHPDFSYMQTPSYTIDGRVFFLGYGFSVDPTPTPTSTSTPTNTPTITPTNTPTTTLTTTPTPNPTPYQTSTPTPTTTNTPTITPTATTTATVTSTVTPTASTTPTPTPTPDACAIRFLQIAVPDSILYNPKSQTRAEKIKFVLAGEGCCGESNVLTINVPSRTPTQTPTQTTTQTPTQTPTNTGTPTNTPTKTQTPSITPTSLEGFWRIVEVGGSGSGAYPCSSPNDFNCGYRYGQIVKGVPIGLPESFGPNNHTYPGYMQLQFYDNIGSKKWIVKDAWISQVNRPLHIITY